MQEKFKEKLIAAREAAEKAASEYLLSNEHKVSAEIQEDRLAMCNECKYLSKSSNRCNLCGCFMGVKTWMKSQKCPINKWGPGIDIQEVE